MIIPEVTHYKYNITVQYNSRSDYVNHSVTCVPYVICVTYIPISDANKPLPCPRALQQESLPLRQQLPADGRVCRLPSRLADYQPLYRRYVLVDKLWLFHRFVYQMPCVYQIPYFISKRSIFI